MYGSKTFRSMSATSTSNRANPKRWRHTRYCSGKCSVVNCANWHPISPNSLSNAHIAMRVSDSSTDGCLLRRWLDRFRAELKMSVSSRSAQDRNLLRYSVVSDSRAGLAACNMTASELRVSHKLTAAKVRASAPKSKAFKALAATSRTSRNSEALVASTAFRPAMRNADKPSGASDSMLRTTVATLDWTTNEFEAEPPSTGEECMFAPPPQEHKARKLATSRARSSGDMASHVTTASSSKVSVQFQPRMQSFASVITAATV
mmetsp:Transcript_77123/g.249668  ORF Transcript_77123/g.249668 Transcript_77123/m.249668 type:complete len:261 (-) Transcript_77123:499-1281(-)